MDIFDNLANGIVAVATPMNLLLLFAGVLMGMVVGVMPGLGPSAGLAILLPITFTLDPTGAVVMLAAVYYGAMYGGTITSVLINTPGESATVASTFDGYPLAKQGRAGPALVIAAVGSFAAGTICAVLISIASPVTASIAATLRPAGAVPGRRARPPDAHRDRRRQQDARRPVRAASASRSPPSASTSAPASSATPSAPVELINGIDFIPVAIGLFGVGEVLHTLWRGGHLEKLDYFNVSARSKGFWPTKQDYKESAGPITRGTFLGFFVGATPGAGATVASLMSYNLEKSVSKTPEKFGKGAMAGLAGPEAANNAASSGAMVPLLTLGIPGSASTAVLIGGFMMWGLQPGPLLMEQNPEFAWGLIASMFLGNMMLLVVNVFCIPAFASIARVPFRVLGPIIIAVCVLGTFTVNGSIVEVGVMLVCGVLGFFMRRFGLSPAAMVIALVLGPMAEETLRQTMIVSGGDYGIFVDRTTSLVLLVLIAMLLFLPLAARGIKHATARAVQRYGASRRLSERAEARRGEGGDGGSSRGSDGGSGGPGDGAGPGRPAPGPRP